MYEYQAVQSNQPKIAPRCVSRQEAARALSVSTRTLDRWIRRGQIRMVRVNGGRVLIPVCELDRIAGLDAATAN